MDAPIHLPLFPTGVGSMRHRAADDAVDEVLEGYWRMPFWPQLPNRDPLEAMLPQAGLSLPGASWDGRLLRWTGALSDAQIAAAEPPPPERAAGYHELLKRLPALPDERRPTVVKGQSVGPITLARWSQTESGAPLWENPAALERLGAFLGNAAMRQAQAFQALGFQAVVIFDEPELAAVGEPALPLAWRQVEPVLRAAIEPLKRVGALAGIHCCAAPNWTRVLDARPNLIHFDGREGNVEDVIAHRSAVREHVARGGYLGWGLWPTDAAPPAADFDAREMQYFLARAARELSFVDASVGLIFKRSILTSVCGSGSLPAELERRVAADLEDLSMGIRRRYWIAATTDVDPDNPLT